MAAMTPDAITAFARLAVTLGWAIEIEHTGPDYVDATVFGSISKTYLAGEGRWTIAMHHPDKDPVNLMVSTYEINEVLARLVSQL
jgi:hypothetical protein